MKTLIASLPLLLLLMSTRDARAGNSPLYSQKHGACLVYCQGQCRNSLQLRCMPARCFVAKEPKARQCQAYIQASKL